MAYRLAELAEQVGAELIGDPEVSIESIGSLAEAVSGQITFLSDPPLLQAIAPYSRFCRGCAS